MYNDYVIVGPKNDNIECKSIEKKINNIFTKEKLFISRDDDSGTNIFTINAVALWIIFTMHPAYVE